MRCTECRSSFSKLCGRPPKYATPCKLTFDLLTLKVVFESRVTWATSVPILVYRPLRSRLRPDVRDRQTSDAHHRLMPPIMGAGHNNNNDVKYADRSVLRSVDRKRRRGEWRPVHGGHGGSNRHSVHGRGAGGRLRRRSVSQLAPPATLSLRARRPLLVRRRHAVQATAGRRRRAVVVVVVVVAETRRRERVRSRPSRSTTAADHPCPRRRRRTAEVRRGSDIGAATTPEGL